MADKELPSKVTMGLNLLKAGVKAVAHTVREKELPISKESLKKLRMDICMVCDLMLPPKKKVRRSHKCKKCGCTLEHKTGVKSESCPLGKW